MNFQVSTNRFLTHLKHRGVFLGVLPVMFGLYCLWGCKNGPSPKNTEEMHYVHQIYQFRAEKDKDFKMAGDSPLLKGDKETFSGLKYFPVNPEMRFVLKLQRIDIPDTIEIMTTNGKDRSALRYGYFEFEAENEKLRLYTYKFLDNNKNNDFSLFVPFLDQTAGEETYGGGRYLDLEENERGIYELDFNLAYNPSCAYGRKEYICPIPPSENTLSVAILAGEKAWHE